MVCGGAGLQRAQLMPTWWHDLSWVLPLRSEYLTPVFLFFTNLGALNAYILIILLMAWLWHQEFIDRMLPWIGVSIISNSWLKAFFTDPRPDALFRLPDYSANGFGMPSGHAQLAVMFWGAVALELARTKSSRGLIVAALGTAFMISFSRLYLAVHDVQDVTIGAMIGAVLVAIYFLARRFPAPAPSAVIAGFLLFALAAFFSWPGGPDPGAVVPALALVFSWYGTRMISSHSTQRPSFQRQLIFAIGGVILVAAIAVGVGNIMQGWPANTLLLFCIGVIGVMLPRLSAQRV